VAAGKFGQFSWLNGGVSLTFAHFSKFSYEKMEKMRQGCLLILLTVAYLGCQQDAGKPGKQIEEIKTEGKISSIIRNPINVDGTVDTVNVAKMVFEEPIFEFGEVDEGAVIKHEFKFVNTGKVPLIIQNCHSTCGCTVAEWPKDLVEPGQSGVIKAEFDTKGKADFQEKPIIITANTIPSVTKVYLKGNVNKKG
jgi:Protein of unknown function (DUF1573)